MNLLIKADIPRTRSNIAETRSLVENLVTTAMKIASQDWENDALKVQFIWEQQAPRVKRKRDPTLFKSEPRGSRRSTREDA